MSTGDDYRLIARNLRCFRLDKNRSPHLTELYQISNLSRERFNAAVSLGIDDEYFMLDENTKIITEGKILMEQKTPNSINPITQQQSLIGFIPKDQPLWEKILVGFFSLVLIFFLMYVSMMPEDLSPQKWRIVQLFASFNAAALGAFLPGMFEVRGERSGLFVRATGSLAAFVFVFWLF